MRPSHGSKPPLTSTNRGLYVHPLIIGENPAASLLRQLGSKTVFSSVLSKDYHNVLRITTSHHNYYSYRCTVVYLVRRVWLFTICPTWQTPRCAPFPSSSLLTPTEETRSSLETREDDTSSRCRGLLRYRTSRPRVSLQARSARCCGACRCQM